jgi:hypothetical protein
MCRRISVLTIVPLLIIDDLGMRKLGPTAAEELLEIVMRRYERASTLVTSNRPVEDWGKLLGDSAAVTAMLDRLLHHGHILKCGSSNAGRGVGESKQACLIRRKRDKKDHVPGHLIWPVLKWPRMAGFALTPEAIRHLGCCQFPLQFRPASWYLLEPPLVRIIP